MRTYIALLRGINISGQKLMKMADLRTYMEEIGFQNVVTYIQSGNIIFKSELSSKNEIEERIKNMISDKFGFEVPTQVKQLEDLQYVLDNCPFLDPSRDMTKLYVTFLASEPEEDRIQSLLEYDFPPEEYILEGTDIFFYSPNGYGNAKMNNNFFEAKLKVAATTRNWKTVNRLVEMAKS